jgi:hypothetical protein
MAPENGGKMAVGEIWRDRQKDFFCGKNLWLAFIAGNSFNLSSRGEEQRPFFSVRISVCKRIWLEIGTVEISGWKKMPSASRKIEKIDKIFSVRTSAWRSVRKQKRKRAEVTVLYGIVEKYVKNLCIRRRWVTREYERRKMRALFFTA